MAGPAEKVRSLIEQDEGMADALSAVHRIADGEAVEWSDVSDDISSGHWGRLIEQGVLVDGGDGFRLADPEAVAEVLEESERGAVSYEGEEVDEESSWTIYDKLAALGALGMFAGYSIPQVRAVIGGTIDVVLGPLNAVLPFHLVVLVIAVLTGLVSTLVQGNLMDVEKIQEYQQQMQAIQERRKEAKERGDEEAIKEIQEEQMEAMGDQLGMFKEQFRPTVWIMFFSIPMFLWIYWMVLDGHVQDPTVVLPLVGETEWTGTVIGPIQTWIVWYFLCSLGFTNIIRKALNIQTTPTSS